MKKACPKPPRIEKREKPVSDKKKKKGGK